MAEEPKTTHRFAAEEGRRFMKGALAAAGVPDPDAEDVAEAMLFADLRGVDSHGIVRLPTYIRRLRAGGINPRPRIHIAREADATALVDGDNGMGHLVMRFAARVAMEKAEARGVAWVGARASNHAGAAACYAMMPLARDMIGLYLAVANNNHMAPTGGFEPLLGTNPIAIAVPTLEEPPVVLDIATTTISFGRIRNAADAGESLPEGLVMDYAGRPVTDPNQANHALLAPIGGYKGYGLSLMFSLLSGVLNGTATGRDAVNIEEASAPGNTGQTILALKAANFGPVDDFKRRVDKVARDLRASKPMPGVAEVRYPGLGGYRIAEARRREGVPIRPGFVAALGRLAADLGIAKLALL